MDSPIIGTARVVSVLSENLCLAELPNGKMIHAHLPTEQAFELVPDQSITVELSTYDFSRGRIRLPIDQSPKGPE